eukprot:403374935
MGDVKDSQTRDLGKSICFNLGMGQFIAISLVSGGVFTTHKGEYTPIPIWKFFICAMVDSQATLLIVKSYLYTSITSVMLLQVFSIPSALCLSIFFLKIRYRFNHYLALLFCAAGVAFSIVNDIVLHPKESGQDDNTLEALYGDLMVLVGAFLYATSNILQEHLIKTGADVFNYLGFLGLFGMIITALESCFWFKEYEQFQNVKSGDIYKISLYYVGFVVINFIGYTTIPFFVRRSGATLLNISNLTTIIWSMISDIFLFDRPFYWMYVAGFFVEVFAIVIFSLKPPLAKISNDPNQNCINKSILTNNQNKSDQYISGNSQYISFNSPQQSKRGGKNNDFIQVQNGADDTQNNSALLKSMKQSENQRSSQQFRSAMNNVLEVNDQTYMDSHHSSLGSNYDDMFQQDQMFAGATEAISALKMQSLIRGQFKEIPSSMTETDMNHFSGVFRQGDKNPNDTIDVDDRYMKNRKLTYL